ncbi:hypothetical protein GKA01_13550 [Gluconobacter kanchanaburiensis NBRC 103587]|uniref:Uncharacterized protein n=1 Tax=Gluconobacter kanchanaburiensis NBRC 103587 TaxID=1307948 RepID=A0A511B6Y8_9PROT|nr:hypothetical protein [Gluconobacter kanchanaburiensis]GBR69416.1 hypothetical protein AA103587_1311 [Gluconobacter kanchanaburiensis NBRC 103587]GEK96158.1 hypothetical protein GKA01_13550 [Gluconobacter kanchanaburiensis NBRC 103587]
MGGAALAQEPKIEAAVASAATNTSPRVTQVADTKKNETSTQVWVNTATHVCHMLGSFWYGAYMCEDDAKRVGNTRGQYGREIAKRQGLAE